MKDVLYRVIYNQAVNTYNGPEFSYPDNYQIWVDHWFKTAEEVAAKFEKEGLINTAKTVRDYMVQQRKLGDYVK